MGIGGHILGERKLRRVNRETGMQFDRAFRYHDYGEGRQVIDGRCRHFDINFRTWEVEEDEKPSHWESCPREAR